MASNKSDAEMASIYIRKNNSDDSDDYDQSSDDDVRGNRSSSESSSESSQDVGLSESDNGSTEMSKLILENTSLGDGSEVGDGNESNSSTGKGARMKNKDYDYVKTYPSLVAAKEGVTRYEIGGKSWTRSVSYPTNYGDKVCYTCRGYPKCPKRMQMLLDTESQDVHIHLSSDSHDHTSTTSRSNPQLNPQSRSKVLELIAVGVHQPRKLIKQLEINNLPILTRNQISNLKARTSKKVVGPLTCSLSTFLLWAKKRNKVPEDDDEVYVIAYDYKLSKKSKIKDLRCVMSTKRLISQAKKSNFFNIFI